MSDTKDWQDLPQTDPTTWESASARELLQAVRDWIKFAANSEGGIVREIDDFLGTGVVRFGGPCECRALLVQAVENMRESWGYFGGAWDELLREFDRLAKAGE